MKKKKKICPNEYEHACWEKTQLVCGIDEAGRGPLAGPLSVAGVIFPAGYENPEIYDSKALSPHKREELFKIIQEDALWFEIIEVSESDIDLYNILEADRRAMKEIANDAPCSFILTDAMKFELPDKTITDMIKGDQKSISIAAGSILAKVTRDHIMQEYDRIYPGYGFAHNMGYPTREHMAAIEEKGITPIHRHSFAPVRYHQEKLF